MEGCLLLHGQLLQRVPKGGLWFNKRLEWKVHVLNIEGKCESPHVLLPGQVWDGFPLAGESLVAVSWACWFSTLDIVSRLHKVTVAELYTMKTTFCTHFVICKFN